MASTSDSEKLSGSLPETDLTEPDAELPARRHPRLNANYPCPELAPDNDEEGFGKDFLKDPLDGTGIDLSKIPEDFGKACGTISLQERIEVCWSQSVILF